MRRNWFCGALLLLFILLGAWGSVVVTTSRTVPGSIPGGVTGDFFFRGSFRQNHVPWGRLSLWKWVPEISPVVKAAGAYDWRPTTLVVPNVEMICGLNLLGTPRATSACRGTPLPFISIITFFIFLVFCKSDVSVSVLFIVVSLTNHCLLQREKSQIKSHKKLSCMVQWNVADLTDCKENIAPWETNSRSVSQGF